MNDITASTGSTPYPEPIRPTGVSWVTVVLGVACLAAVGWILAQELFDVDCSLSPEGMVIVTGVMLVAFRLAAMTHNSEREQTVESQSQPVQ